ncbi:hypothetical protein [Algoriphagus sp. PAP.12]|uniref:hypothetical protein n=1 Tax=Algoriphagus sp. PAP.12 TaxID=2996678 RepID=UPI00227AA8CF|nr:hypothetical protein [Algoriphagus sp. PAP.12]
MLRTLQIFSIATLLAIIWGIPRGFDFSDEGLYVLLADPGQSNSNGPILYDLFFKILFKVFGIQFHIIELRWIRLSGIIFASIALYFFLRRSFGEKVNPPVYWIVILGLLGSYAFLPPNLSYNTLLLIGTCIWLYTLSLKNRLGSFLEGLILALLFYVKLPAAGLLLIMTIAVSWRSQKSNQIWKLIGLLVSILILEIIFYWSFKDGLFSRIEFFLSNPFSRPSYNFLNLLKSTLVGVFWMFLSFIVSFLCRKLITNLKLERALVIAINLSILAAIGWVTHITSEWNHLVLIAFGGVLGWVYSEIDFKKNAISNSPINCVLLILPFVLHFGSNVYWLRLGIHFWIFWILLLYLSWNNGRKLIAYAIGPVIFILVFLGVWVNPFEQKPLWEAKYEWKYGGNNAILLNKEQISFLEILKGIENISNSNEIACAYRNPGMAYLLDKKNWGKIGFWERSELEFEISKGLPKSIIFYSLDSLPASFSQGYQRKSVGIYQGVETEFLWK